MDRFAVIEGSAPVLSAGVPLLSSVTLEAGVLTLHGYGFPVKDTTSKADKARYQRVKLVAAGSRCTAAVPKEVSGVNCAESVIRVDRSASQKPGNSSKAGTAKQTVYTICSTRPTSGSTSEKVEWVGISILPGASDTDYDACYCDGKNCASPASWVKIPGSLTVPRNAYSYDVASSSFPRAPLQDVTITVHGDVGVPMTDWGVKVVPASFGCSVESPFTLDDSAKPDYVVSFGGTVDDVGEYTVCYDSGSGFEPLEGALTMTALPTDRTHTRNVFREQRWSVAAGSSARQLSIRGTGLPAVLDSKVVFAEGSNCEWPEMSFPGKKTMVPPAADFEAPVVDWTASEPSTVVSSGALIKLVFNEPVKSEECEGNYSLKADPASSVSVGYVECGDAQIVDNYVLLDFSKTAVNGTIPDGEYFVIIESYVILDMAGNYMLYQSSKEPSGTVHFSYTVGTDVTVPVVVSSIPEPSGLMTDGRVIISFSEVISVVAGGRIDLVDCGEDMKCATADPLLARFHLNSTYYNSTDANGTTYGPTGASTYDAALEEAAAIVQKGSDLIVNVVTGVDFTVYDYRRYKLIIPAGDLEDAAGNPTDAAVEFEFLKDGTAMFDPSNIIAATSSSATGLTFDVQLTSATTPGTFTMCYCNSNVDETLVVQGDMQTTYKATFGSVLAENTGFTGLVVGSRDISEHVCEEKCHAGCLGSDCFCSGFDDAAVDATAAFCLSPEMCRDVCDYFTACVGFSTTESNACILSTSGSSSDSGSWTSFVKSTGTACTDPHDFDTPVGKVTVTARAHIGAEYVVEPSTKTTIEVAGSGLMTDVGGIPFSSDRIMIVDCDGKCGYSNPSSSVTLEEGMTWHDLMPTNPLSHDPPHDMPPNPSYNPDHIASAFAHGPCPYVSVYNVYCPGDNYVAAGKEIVYEGFKRKVSEHLCYNKCIASTCEGDDCFCEGAYAGYDGPTSNAFCADADLCKMLCDNDDTCRSIDMSTDRTRCFLNVAGPEQCEYDPHTSSATKSKSDIGYALHFKQVDQCEARRMSTAKPSGRALMETMDFEYSHSKLLRYNGITFTTGGSFKACFCDATLLKPGETCSSPADYSVEVGEVQASGISCLLKDATYSRKTCYEMKPHGGLRCYDGEGPDTEAPRYNHDGTLA
jgi:hypothetical protein